MFSHEIETIRHFCQCLERDASPSPIQRLTAQALHCLTDCPALFDTCVSADTPFFAEFMAALHTGATDADTCFAMFECLVIFFREKMLRSSSHTCSAAEQRILRYFEASPEWDNQLQLLVCSWYWYELPRRVHSLSRRRG